MILRKFFAASALSATLLKAPLTSSGGSAPLQRTASGGTVADGQLAAS